jgi:dUTP pyrophosphatase
MKLEISRIDQDLPMPAYATDGSAAFDVYARMETVVLPKQIALIPANLVFQLPPGHALIVASRSSTPLKKGLLTPHGFGLLDTDFRGPKDELKVQVYNFTDQPVTVARGERIAQAFVLPIERCELAEVPLPQSGSRGGFGSTG